MKTYLRAPLALAAATATQLISPSAWSLDATASASYRAEHTTNTARTADNRVDEWIHVPGFDIGLFQESERLALDAGYHYEKRFHEEDLFNDQSSTTGSAGLVWRALPERLEVSVRNTRLESTQRSLAALTEANRQEISATAAGPTLLLRPTSNSEMQIQYLYTDINVAETDTDSQRHFGGLTYVVNLSRTNAVTLAGNYSAVNFENPLAPDLDVSQATITYSETRSTLDYSLTGGYNRTERGLGNDTVGGAVLLATAAWNATPSMLITVDASRQITDRSNSLVNDNTDYTEQLNEDTDINAVFTETIGSLSVSHPLGNNQLVWTISGNRENYEDVPRDNDRYLASLGLTRQLNPRTTLDLIFEAGRRKYTDEDREQDELRGEIRLGREFGRRLNAGLALRYEEWDAEDDIRSFDEWIAVISLEYDILPGR